ncbi:MAG TPA: aminoglycoside phosphotransferase family protein [Candidatus Nanoarchaeia archaeon]|nr:aminoglycoside phosphotransferase family protein [Candidatus Nanoarchaeia archaeon]
MKRKRATTNIFIKSLIKDKIPAIKLKSIKFLGCGADNDAYLINNLLILRFPKPEYKKSHIEAKQLLELSNYIKLKIPKPLYIKKYNNKTFIVYESVPGQSLTKELLGSLNSKQVKKLFNQVLEFLDQLHSFPVEKAKKLGVKEIDSFSNFKIFLNKCRKKAFKKLNEYETEGVEAIFKGYLENPLNFKYKPALLHDDFSIGHIFYDEKLKKAVGVIDFGDIIVNDPDRDLIYLFKFGKTFSNYLRSRKDFDLVKRKINFWLLTRDLDHFIKAIKNKNKEQFDKERSDINERIKSFYEFNS